MPTSALRKLILSSGDVKRFVVYNKEYGEKETNKIINSEVSGCRERELSREGFPYISLPPTRGGFIKSRLGLHKMGEGK